MKSSLNKAVTTLVGADTTVTGNMLIGRGCHVAGTVRGDVLAESSEKGALSVAEGAKIEGNVRASIMLIEGTVLGDLACSGTVSLAASARVEGSIEYGQIEIEQGAFLTGSLNRITQKSARKSAKSKASEPAARRDESDDAPMPAAAG